jgi:glycosyltransferase involved in cell wall biosynthesis
MLPAVGLVMIVKDEEAVIERALRSALPYISTWVIVDTGSTDRTKEIIRAVMSGIPGILVDRPWTNFGVNRSEAMALCDGRMKWAIMMDADDTIEGVIPNSYVWEHNDIDAFTMTLKHGSMIHRRLQIFRTGLEWRYDGPVHETPDCRGKSDIRIGVLPPEIYMVTRCEGARSRNPTKYLDDALLLEQELQGHPDNPRIVFYIAQSYRDAGMRDKAFVWYKRYLDISSGEISERYLCYMNLIALTTNEDDQFRYAWAGVNLFPDRLEVPYALFSQRRKDRRPITQECFALSNMTTMRMINPAHSYSIPEIYAWGFDNERAVISAETGHKREAYESSLRCVANAPNEEMRTLARHNVALLEKEL